MSAYQMRTYPFTRAYTGDSENACVIPGSVIEETGSPRVACKTLTVSFANESVDFASCWVLASRAFTVKKAPIRSGAGIIRNQSRRAERARTAVMDDDCAGLWDVSSNCFMTSSRIDLFVGC